MRKTLIALHGGVMDTNKEAFEPDILMEINVACNNEFADVFCDEKDAFTNVLHYGVMKTGDA